ncbi:MAG: hypothetical protein ACR2J4_07665 [Deinococcus sp.]
MTDPLASLLAYYEPLAALRRDFRGTATLHTPGSPLLAANASYLLSGSDGDVLPLLRAWHHAHDAPPLVASAGPLAGQEPQESWRCGRYRPSGLHGPLAVEQVSRLHLSTFAGILAEAQGLPEWAGPLARSLAPRLEALPSSTLLLAYAGSEAVGALLLLGAAAHLWATLDPGVDRALLDAAAELAGGTLEVSLTDTSPLSVEDQAEVCFTLLD